MEQLQYKLEELKIFKGEDDDSEPYSDIYDSYFGIELENISDIPDFIKAACEKSINKLLQENYEKTNKAYTKDDFEVSMSIDLDTENGTLIIYTYVGYWELDLSEKIDVASLDCHEEIKDYFFAELEKITAERINQIKSMVA